MTLLQLNIDADLPRFADPGDEFACAYAFGALRGEQQIRNAMMQYAVAGNVPAAQFFVRIIERRKEGE